MPKLTLTDTSKYVFGGIPHENAEILFEQNGGTYTQYAKALDEVVKIGDALTASLNEDEKRLFEDFMAAQREVTVITDRETFCYASNLGAKNMLDVLNDGPMKEI